LRKVLSECSSIAKNIMETKQVSPAAETLLWVRLSRLFGDEDELWRLADIVGLISRNGALGIGRVSAVDQILGLPWLIELCRQLGHLFRDFPVERVSVQRSQPRAYGAY
jgi:hypothetical protein